MCDGTANYARRLPLWNATLQRTIDDLATVRLEVVSMVERPPMGEVQ